MIDGGLWKTDNAIRKCMMAMVIRAICDDNGDGECADDDYKKVIMDGDAVDDKYNDDDSGWQ